MTRLLKKLQAIGMYLGIGVTSMMAEQALAAEKLTIPKSTPNQTVLIDKNMRSQLPLNPEQLETLLAVKGVKAELRYDGAVTMADFRQLQNGTLNHTPNNTQNNTPVPNYNGASVSVSGDRSVGFIGNDNVVYNNPTIKYTIVGDTTKRKSGSLETALLTSISARANYDWTTDGSGYDASVQGQRDTQYGQLELDLGFSDFTRTHQTVFSGPYDETSSGTTTTNREESTQHITLDGNWYHPIVGNNDKGISTVLGLGVDYEYQTTQDYGTEVITSNINGEGLRNDDFSTPNIYDNRGDFTIHAGVRFDYGAFQNTTTLTGALPMQNEARLPTHINSTATLNLEGMTLPSWNVSASYEGAKGELPTWSAGVSVTYDFLK